MRRPYRFNDGRTDAGDAERARDAALDRHLDELDEAEEADDKPEPGEGEDDDE